jgi:putative SOS response-associated peptidase YedK
MCGRYISTSSQARLVEFFGVDDVRSNELPPRYNVAPTQAVYAVTERRARQKGEESSRQLRTLRWGLVPSWARDPKIGNRAINARAETVATKNAYKKALARRRCLIPADGFYEWQVRHHNGKKHRLPYLIQPRDGGPMAFAGLWETWRDHQVPDADPLRSCVIITTEANKLLAPIHARMPVVLAASTWDVWLDPGNEDVTALRKLLVPAPAMLFELCPVSTRVNDVAHEGPELIDPISTA